MTTLSEAHALSVIDPFKAYRKIWQTYPVAQSFRAASPISAGRFINAVETLKHFLSPHFEQDKCPRDLNAELHFLQADPVGGRLLAQTLSRAATFEKTLPDLQAQRRIERNLFSRSGAAWVPS